MSSDKDTPKDLLVAGATIAGIAATLSPLALALAGPLAAVTWNRVATKAQRRAEKLIGYMIACDDEPETFAEPSGCPRVDPALSSEHVECDANRGDVDHVRRARRRRTRMSSVRRDRAVIAHPATSASTTNRMTLQRARRRERWVGHEFFTRS